MIQKLIFISLIGLILSGNLVRLEDEPVIIENLTTRIQPEYDRTEVLVIHDIIFSSDTPLQSEVVFHIPVEAAMTFSVDYYGDDGTLHNLSYDADRDADWLKITFLVPTQKIRLEYYDPRTLIWGSQRTFVYRWAGDYIVKNMTILVKQPIHASDFTIDPDMGSGFLGSDGLITYLYTPDDIIAGGNLFTVALTYNKSDNELSAQLQGIEPVQTLEIIKLKSSPSQHAFPWLFGILGIALIACGWFVYSYMGKYPVHIINRVDQAAAVEGDHTSDEVIYCSQCGKRAEPGELTCSNCGTKY